MNNFDENTFLTALQELEHNVDIFEEEIERKKFAVMIDSDYCNSIQLNNCLHYTKGYKKAIDDIKLYMGLSKGEI